MTCVLSLPSRVLYSGRTTATARAIVTENSKRLKSVRRIVVLPPLGGPPAGDVAASTPPPPQASAPQAGVPQADPPQAESTEADPGEIPRKKKRKKQSWLLRPLERVTRTLVQAQVAAATTYLEAHDRSARKEKDGWIIDLGRNSGRAWRAGVKQLKRPL
jgi:hypothetical protein